MKKIIIILSVITFLFACNKIEKNESKILHTEWTCQDSLIVLKDSIITITQNMYVDEFGNQHAYDGQLDAMNLKIKTIEKDKIITNGDIRHRNDTLLYEIKIINNEPYLFVIFNKPQYDDVNVMTTKKIVVFTPKIKLNFKETNNIATQNFKIDGYQIGDTISLDSLAYFPNFFEDYTLLSNPNITFHIVGNRIIDITKGKILDYEIDNIVVEVSKQIKTKPNRPHRKYQSWEEGSLFVLLGTDLNNKFDSVNIYLALSCNNLIKEKIIEIESQNNNYYKNIKERKNEIRKIQNSIFENINDLNKVIELSTKAIMTDNKYYTGYYLRGLAKKELNNKIGAISDYKNCLKINSYHIDAMRELTIMYYNKKIYQEFLLYANKIINLNHQETVAYRLLAAYYYDVDKQKSCDYLNKAFENGDKEALALIEQFCN